jgi:hypothetical protein
MEVIEFLIIVGGSQQKPDQDMSIEIPLSTGQAIKQTAPPQRGCLFLFSSNTELLAGLFGPKIPLC